MRVANFPPHNLLIRFWLRVFVYAVTAALFIAPYASWAASYRLDYTVSHSSYGNIGTYSNTIESDGPNTTVTTQSNIAVHVLGIIAHRQSSQRVEKWNGDRLVYFHATNNINGKISEVNGVAQGNQFAVSTPSGTITTPGLIRVANPWSPTVMNGDMILTPDDGLIQKAQISAGQDTTVKVNGMDVAAKLYDIALVGTKKRYQVWFDSSGIPVKFTMIDSGSTVTFTLTGQKPANQLLAQKPIDNPSPSPR